MDRADWISTLVFLGFDFQCGEGTFALSCTGLACAFANLVVAVPVQLGVRGHLRRRDARCPETDGAHVGPP